MEDFFCRSFEFKKDSLDKEKREVMLSFSSETSDVERWFGIEILSHKKGAMNLKRLRSVGALVFNHTSEIIGPIKKVQNNEKLGRGEALVGFDPTEEGNKRMLQVETGSLRGVSFHYRIKKMRELAPGEEYELASKTVKGQKDKPIMIAEEWEPTEISLLPQPYDISVGVGRALTRSLEGIEVINHKQEDKKMGDENKNTMDAEQIRSLIGEELKKIVPDIVSQTKAALAEDAKPKMRVTTEEFRDLTNRASAISERAMNDVTNLCLEGKTEPEVLRFIADELVKGADGGNSGNRNDGEDGTKRDLDKNKGSNENIRSFKDITDEQFFNTLKNPGIANIH